MENKDPKQEYELSKIYTYIAHTPYTSMVIIKK